MRILIQIKRYIKIDLLSVLYKAPSPPPPPKKKKLRSIPKVMLDISLPKLPGPTP